MADGRDSLGGALIPLEDYIQRGHSGIYTSGVNKYSSDVDDNKYYNSNSRIIFDAAANLLRSIKHPDRKAAGWPTAASAVSFTAGPQRSQFPHSHLVRGQRPGSPSLPQGRGEARHRWTVPGRG